MHHSCTSKNEMGRDGLGRANALCVVSEMIFLGFLGPWERNGNYTDDKEDSDSRVFCFFF